MARWLANACLVSESLHKVEYKVWDLQLAYGLVMNFISGQLKLIPLCIILINAALITFSLLDVNWCRFGYWLWSLKNLVVQCSHPKTMRCHRFFFVCLLLCILCHYYRHSVLINSWWIAAYRHKKAYCMENEVRIKESSRCLINIYQCISSLVTCESGFLLLHSQLEICKSPRARPILPN